MFMSVSPSSYSLSLITSLDIFARIDIVRAIGIVMESMTTLLVQINEDMHIHCLLVRKLCKFQAVYVNLDTSEIVAMTIHGVALFCWFRVYRWQYYIHNATWFSQTILPFIRPTRAWSHCLFICKSDQNMNLLKRKQQQQQKNPVRKPERDRI